MRALLSTMLRPARLPVTPPLPSCRLPALIVIPPVYVLAPVRVSVPPPVSVRPAVPAITEPTVALPAGNTLMVGLTPPRVRVLPVTLYPLALNVRLCAVIGTPRVTVPAVPPNTASSSAALFQFWNVTPLNQNAGAEVFQVPEPPVPGVMPLASHCRE